MDNFYGKVVFETAVPVENPDNLILFLNSIELQKPELLRLDFATIRTSVSKNPDGTCILTANIDSTANLCTSGKRKVIL